MSADETTRNSKAGFGPWFHFPGAHFGVTRFLTGHSASCNLGSFSKLAFWWAKAGGDIERCSTVA